MKKILLLFVTLLFLQINQTFAQKTQAEALKSINDNVGLNRQITPTQLRAVLTDIVNKSEVLAQPKTVVALNSVAQINDNVAPKGNSGGQARKVTLKYWRVQNATSFEIVLSKTPTLTLPVTYTTTSTNYQLTGLDTNQVYYWKVRGKNSTVNGAWSNVKRFDTYPIPTVYGIHASNINSIFDLEEYISSITILPNLFAVNDELPINTSINTKYRSGTKQIIARKFRGTVSSFPYSISSGFVVDQIIKINETNTGFVTYPAWTNITETVSVDFKTNVINNAGILTHTLPVTTFPIASMDLWLGVYFTLN